MYTGTARTRSYKLAPPEGESEYGSELMKSWMWDFALVEKVKKHDEHIPADVPEAMRNDPNLILDSDDLTKDGFESSVDDESVVVRATVVNGVVTYHTLPSSGRRASA